MSVGYLYRFVFLSLIHHKLYLINQFHNINNCNFTCQRFFFRHANNVCSKLPYFVFIFILKSYIFVHIFQSGGDFSAFWTTLPRAIVMSTGEFEYSSISEELSSNAVLATSTILIFLVFLFLIFLVLMNVMTGLAVTDAKVLRI